MSLNYDLNISDCKYSKFDFKVIPKQFQYKLRELYVIHQYTIWNNIDSQVNLKKQ